MKSWILGSISDDPVDTISAGAISARDAWLAVETQFLGNRETRALYLDAEFRGFSQGDLSITDYCRRLQRMATDLGALGEVVSDRTRQPTGGAKGGQQPDTWPTFWNPWTGSIQMWPGNRPPPARPPQQVQQHQAQQQQAQQ